MHKAGRLIDVILMASVTLPACSSKSGLRRGGQDADQDTGRDVGQDTGQNLRPETGSRPDVVTTPDSQGNQKCFWQDPGVSFKHFAFLLTTPDGQVQGPPRSAGAAAWPINDFTGQVVEKTGNQLAIDTCTSSPSCQPNLYRFVLCGGGSGCSAQPSPSDIDVPIPVGRLVRVVWHVDSARPMSDLGLYWLAIYDAEEGPGHGSLLFLGSGGRKPEDAGTRSYFDDLHFSVVTERLQCGGVYRDGGYQTDDYRFVFSPKTGTGATVKLATGESGSFEFAEDGGVAQRFQVHCLDAVLTRRADDYWNWDFWMTGEIVPGTPVPVDAGRKDDGPGVCTYGMDATCNDSPIMSDIEGTCQSDGTCVCRSGFVIVPSSGRCTRAPRDGGADLAPDAKFGCTPGMDQTCSDTPSSAIWGSCQANGTCVCKGGYALNPSSGRCFWVPDWDAGPGR